MNDQDLLEKISRKLSVLIALNFSKDKTEMTTTDGLRLLSKFGLSNQEMADILGTTKRTIEVTKSRVSNAK